MSDVIHWLNGTLVGCTRERFWTSGLEATPNIDRVTCTNCVTAKQIAHEIGKARRAEFELKRASARAEQRKPKVSLQDISEAFERNKGGL